jgi:(p)ppGpp synthase/HD superfamily hydrolase
MYDELLRIIGMEGKAEKAYKFAKKAHEGQLRKYTGTPYFEHPIRVAGRVAMHPLATEDMICAAYNHDVCEDCGISFLELEVKFGEEVAELVKWLTNPSKGSKLNREARKAMDREHLEKAPKTAKIIKLIDRIDNLNEMSLAEPGFIWKYCKESRLLAEVLKDADLELYNELIQAIENLENSVECQTTI